jgi:hypothetical protein
MPATLLTDAKDSIGYVFLIFVYKLLGDYLLFAT